MASASYERQKAAIARYLQTKERITVWMEPSEKEEIRQKAKDSNMNMSDYIRGKLFDTEGKESGKG